MVAVTGLPQTLAYGRLTAARGWCWVIRTVKTLNRRPGL